MTHFWTQSIADPKVFIGDIGEDGTLDAHSTHQFQVARESGVLSGNMTYPRKWISNLQHFLPDGFL